jgi:hypothetical protein
MTNPESFDPSSDEQAHDRPQSLPILTSFVTGPGSEITSFVTGPSHEPSRREKAAAFYDEHSDMIHAGAGIAFATGALILLSPGLREDISRLQDTLIEITDNNPSVFELPDSHLHNDPFYPLPGISEYQSINYTPADAPNTVPVRINAQSVVTVPAAVVAIGTTK